MSNTNANTFATSNANANNDAWLFVLYSAILFGAGFLFLIMMTSSIKTIEAPIIGYIAVLIALLLILTYISSKMRYIPGKSSILAFIITAGPFLLNAGTIMFFIYLLQKYRNIINDGHVSKQYSFFATVSIFLVFFQIILFYNGMKTPVFKQQHVLPNLYNSASYLVGILNLYVVITIYVILKYYTTDGFDGITVTDY